MNRPACGRIPLEVLRRVRSGGHTTSPSFASYYAVPSWQAQRLAAHCWVSHVGLLAAEDSDGVREVGWKVT